MSPPDPGGWPPVVGFVGPHGAGKTTLLSRLLPIWRGMGLRVAVCKHAHHPIRPGDPVADSERLRAAGAAAAIACAAQVPWQDAAAALLGLEPRADLLVFEGYHAAPVVQIAVLPGPDALNGERARSRGLRIAAVVPAEAAAPPAWWSRDDAAGLAAYVAGHCRLVPGSGSPVAAAVLAGGASRRMGTDKAGLLWQGRTWLERVRDAAAAATGGTAQVIGGGCGEPWRVPDLLPGEGPLAALAAAFHHTRAPWVLLCACDMPLLDAPALAVLLERVRAHPAAAAVLPVVGGRRQYACGAYARRECPSVLAALAAGTRGLRAWVDGLPVVDVGEEAWREWGIDPARVLADIDDPAAVRRLGEG